MACVLKNCVICKSAWLYIINIPINRPGNSKNQEKKGLIHVVTFSLAAEGKIAGFAGTEWQERGISKREMRWWIPVYLTFWLLPRRLMEKVINFSFAVFAGFCIYQLRSSRGCFASHSGSSGIWLWSSHPECGMGEVSWSCSHYLYSCFVLLYFALGLSLFSRYLAKLVVKIFAA